MQVKKRTLKLSTASDGVNAAVIPANFASPSNYTPADTFIKGHLQGIDSALASAGGTAGDISHTSFSAANNTANQTITSFAFNAASVRCFKAQVSVSVIATSNLFEQFDIKAIYNGTSWTMVQDSLGDNTNVSFDITNAGQVRITTPSFAGFTSCTVKFRALVTLQ